MHGRGVPRGGGMMRRLGVVSLRVGVMQRRMCSGDRGITAAVEKVKVSSGHTLQAAMARIARLLCNHPTMTVCSDENGDLVPFPERDEESGKVLLYALAFGSSQEHQRLVNGIGGDKEGIFHQLLSKTSEMHGAEVLARLVAIAIAESRKEDTDGPKVAGVRVNGVPVLVASPFVDAAMTGLGIHQLFALAQGKGDSVPPGEPKIAAAETREQAVQRLTEATFYLAVATDEGTENLPPRPILTRADEVIPGINMEGHKADAGTTPLLLPIFSDPMSAWIYVDRGVNDDDPAAAGKVRKCPGEDLWRCICQLAAPGAARGVVLNPLPHTEPRDGEREPLVLRRDDMWWLFGEDGTPTNTPPTVQQPPTDSTSAA
eukprot:Hpha_TRINITY_DN9330_c0_g1::TRINITY_DN9330_c0_g1_i2::g.26133::m.26133